LKEGFSKQDGWWAQVDGHPHLLIALGGIQQGLGIPPFEFLRSLNGMPCDQLFLRDFHQAWYHHGVDEQITSLPQLLDALKDFVHRQSYQKVIVMGNSMGGYGALLLGHFLKADTVLAFAPQTFINTRLRWWHGDRRWKDQLAAVYALPNVESSQFDLKRVLKVGNGKTRYHIYYSPEDALDSIHAQRLKNEPGVSLHPIDHGAHEVVRVLRDQGTLHQIIQLALLA
jgi:hypothetical protein